MQTVTRLAAQRFGVFSSDKTGLWCGGLRWSPTAESPGFGSSPKPSPNFCISKMTINLLFFFYGSCGSTYLTTWEKVPAQKVGHDWKTYFTALGSIWHCQFFPPHFTSCDLANWRWNSKQRLQSTRTPVFKRALISPCGSSVWILAHWVQVTHWASHVNRKFQTYAVFALLCFLETLKDIFKGN